MHYEHRDAEGKPQTASSAQAAALKAAGPQHFKHSAPTCSQLMPRAYATGVAKPMCVALLTKPSAKQLATHRLHQQEQVGSMDMSPPVCLL